MYTKRDGHTHTELERLCVREIGGGGGSVCTQKETVTHRELERLCVREIGGGGGGVSVYTKRDGHTQRVGEREMAAMLFPLITFI